MGENMALSANNIWEALPIAALSEAAGHDVPDSYKKKFGEALAKGFPSEFQAALSVFVSDTNTAMWASKSLINDPTVIEAKDNYLKKSSTDLKLLDKEAYGVKLLKMADEKVQYGGREMYVMEAKDRLKALELYGKSMGLLGADIDFSSKKFINNNNVEIVLVEPDKLNQEIKTIEHETSVNVKELLNDIELVETEAA